MPQAGEDSKSHRVDEDGEEIRGNQPPLLTMIIPCLNAINMIAKNVFSILTVRKALAKAS